jgi:hypothetical protein
MDGKSKVVAVMIATGRQTVAMNVPETMKLIHDIAIVK